MGSDDFFEEVTETWLVTEEFSTEANLTFASVTKTVGEALCKTFFFPDFICLEMFLGFDDKFSCLFNLELQL